MWITNSLSLVDHFFDITWITYSLTIAKGIAAFANAVFASIIEIAIGNLERAIQEMEDSLQKALPIAIVLW